MFTWNGYQSGVCMSIRTLHFSRSKSIACSRRSNASAHCPRTPRAGGQSEAEPKLESKEEEPAFSSAAHGRGLGPCFRQQNHLCSDQKNYYFIRDPPGSVGELPTSRCLPSLISVRTASWSWSGRSYYLSRSIASGLGRHQKLVILSCLNEVHFPQTLHRVDCIRVYHGTGCQSVWEGHRILKHLGASQKLASRKSILSCSC